MTWILLALLAPLLWASSNIFDKFALDKISKGVYDFLFFGTIGNFIVFLLTYTVIGIDYIGLNALFAIAGGFFIQYSYLFYSKALQTEDASYITPLYISYSVLVLIFGPLFGETINMVQFVSFAIVFLGVAIISLERLSLEIFKYRKGALLMIPAVVFVSFYALFINHSLSLISFTDTFIYDAFGFSLAGLSLLLIPVWRREIIEGIKNSSIRKFRLFLINDVLDLSGHLVYKWSLFIAPSVSLVAVIGGVQPFYVLLIGYLLTKFFPHVITENISKKEVVQKLVGIVFIFIGIFVLSMYQ